MARPLSTTGYAVLGMLALAPLTAYELTQQMQRSLDYCWPTSERSLYDQPERLMDAGLTSVTVEGHGAAARRRYAITPAGRAALSEWLATASAMPRFQNEPLLRVLFADQGSAEDLHRVLGGLRSHVDALRRAGFAQLEPYLEGEGLYQERAHIVTITARLISRLLDALDDWADEVAELTESWSSTDDPALADQTRPLLEALLAEQGQRIAHRG